MAGSGQGKRALSQPTTHRGYGQKSLPALGRYRLPAGLSSPECSGDQARHSQEGEQVTWSVVTTNDPAWGGGTRVSGSPQGLGLVLGNSLHHS